MEQRSPIEVRASRKKAVWTLLGSVLFAGLGILIVIAGIALTVTGQSGFTEVIYAVAGTLAVASFGCAVCIASRTLVEGAAGLFIIDREGLMFCQGHYRDIGLLEWHEVTGVRLLYIQRTRVLGIDVVDRDRLASGAGLLTRTMLHMHESMGLPPIQIPANAVDMDLDELFMLIQRYRSGSKTASVLERALTPGTLATAAD